MVHEYFFLFFYIGSSTACIVTLNREERRVYSANLGDSGFLIIRDGEVVHRSEEQQHYFNTPFQLAVAPPSQQGLVLSDRYVQLMVKFGFMVFNATFNNISVISWRSVLLVEKTTDLS